MHREPHPPRATHCSDRGRYRAREQGIAPHLLTEPHGLLALRAMSVKRMHAIPGATSSQKTRRSPGIGKKPWETVPM